jgi:hypothetical protein
VFSTVCIHAAQERSNSREETHRRISGTESALIHINKFNQHLGPFKYTEDTMRAPGATFSEYKALKKEFIFVGGMGANLAGLDRCLDNNFVLCDSLLCLGAESKKVFEHSRGLIVGTSDPATCQLLKNSFLRDMIFFRDDAAITCLYCMPMDII